MFCFKTFLNQNKHQLTVFSVENCPDCDSLKQHLTSTNREFTIKDCSSERIQFRSFLLDNYGIIKFRYPAIFKDSKPVIFKDNKIVDHVQIPQDDVFLHILFN